MAYIGQDIEGGVLEKQTLPANGVLTSFDLDYFSDANGLIVSVQGVVQEPGVAYTVSGKKINFTAAPSATAYVVFIERELTVTTVLPNDWIDYQTGTANGSATPLTLSHSTSDPEDIMVTLNGLTQRPTTDYTVSGTTLTFTTAPTSGMVITVYHLRLTKVDGVPLDGTVTNSKIVSMNAAKLTGSLPSSMSVNLSKQFRAMSAVALHWASVENKVAMNLQQDFLDHFQDDTGWVAYNGVAQVPAMGDYSSHGHTVTANGDAAASTAQKKIGTHSIAFDGTGDYVSIPDSDLWTLGTDWTVEFWVRFNTLQKQSLMGVFSNAATSGLQWQLIMEANNTIEAVCCNASTTFGYCVSGGLSANTWYHITYQRDSTNQFCLYIDGTPVYTRSHTHTMQNLSLPLEMGRNTYAGLNSLNGYLDEVRISNIARYTYNTAFTPSTTAFTSDANTLLLVHGEGRAAVTNTGSENVGRDTAGEYMAATSQSADPDNYFLCSQTTEANGSTTFTDSTGNETFSISGNTQWDTSQAKFGSSSIRQASTGNYFRVEDNATLESVIQGTTWTMDVWLRTNGTPGSGVIFLKEYSGNSYNTLQLDFAQGAGCRLLVS